MRTKKVWIAGAMLPCLAIPLCAGPSLAAEVSPPADAAAAPAAAASPTTQRSGTFKVKATLDVSASLPNGTQISANANAQVSDKVFTGNINLFGVSAVSGGKVTFQLLLPYAWLVASAADKVSVDLSVSGSAFGPGTIRYSAQSSFSQTIALPKNGATTPVIFTGSL